MRASIIQGILKLIAVIGYYIFISVVAFYIWVLLVAFILPTIVKIVTN